ncbi:hypothetical protein PbB2_00790 [Candidatus Phycosocius bacilliformis]|uniref:Lysophospholipase n=1 Tax=Candidatus Phycosocius bacilliformis TaxID=1445552 RepID=A0A2P2E7U1_9PROT|nr:DUF1489 family protein [Candidatus Phycosocius bacilliformis]GBF57130.1 hypothetical protein PbB2_00790 [Candidatus Phycosocius bacilliformis]
MALHVIKLCVGAVSIQDLVDWHDHQAFSRLALGLDPRPVCDTRMTPKRRSEILDGGSLYWVIKGQILVRQEIEDIVTLEEADGRTRCEIVLKHHHILTAPRRRAAFQGWRYLQVKDAPPDLKNLDGGDELPEPLRKELLDLGAW